MPRVLVSDKLALEGIEILKKVAEVDVITGLPEDELCGTIGDYDALVIRSGTTVTAKVLEAAKKLRIIGRAGVGVDNVDVPVATEKGVIVVNSPGGNTLAAAELSVAMLLALSRNIPQAYYSMVKKEWNRSKYTGNEVYAKTLGISGLGQDRPGSREAMPGIRDESNWLRSVYRQGCRGCAWRRVGRIGGVPQEERLYLPALAEEQGHAGDDRHEAVRDNERRRSHRQLRPRWDNRRCRAGRGFEERQVRRAPPWTFTSPSRRTFPDELFSFPTSLPLRISGLRPKRLR